MIVEADHTEVLRYWSEVCLEEISWLQPIPGIRNDDETQVATMDELNALCPEYLGSLSVVMSGPEIFLYDGVSQNPIYTGPLQISGWFGGAIIYDHDDKNVDIGFDVRYPKVYNSFGSGHIKFGPVALAVGPMETTGIWTPEDVFKGGSGLVEGEVPADELLIERGRIEKVDEFIDASLVESSGSIDLATLVNVFTNQKLVQNKFELDHFQRRMNTRMQTAERTFSVTTRQIYVATAETPQFQGVLGERGKTTLTLGSGCTFRVIETQNGGRMLCLVANTYGSDGFPMGEIAINLADTTEVATELPPSIHVKTAAVEEPEKAQNI